jgi:hypothetical protein
VGDGGGEHRELWSNQQLRWWQQRWQQQWWQWQWEWQQWQQWKYRQQCQFRPLKAWQQSVGWW